MDRDDLDAPLPGDVLDVGPSPRSAEDPRPGSGPGRWLGLLALAVIGVLVVGAITHGRGAPARQPAGQASSAPATAQATPAGGRSTAAPSTTPASIAPAPRPTPPVLVTQVGHPLLAVPTDWEVFGRGPGVLVRIQLALGRITQTIVPDLSSSGPVFFVVGPDRAIVRPLDPVLGFVVPDGHPAGELPATFSQGPILPGPNPAQVWRQEGTGEHAVMTLTSLDGRRSGVTVPLPGDRNSVVSDATGYLLVTKTGGVFDARPGGLRRITTGALLAVGPTRWLTVECDDRDRCATVVTDRVSGAQRALGPAQQPNGPLGVISPDGSTAALQQQDRTGTPRVHLLDLATGADHSFPMMANAVFGGDDGSLVWSPDSRWLFAAGAGTGILVIDAGSGHAQNLSAGLPQISQLALRTAPR